MSAMFRTLAAAFQSPPLCRSSLLITPRSRGAGALRCMSSVPLMRPSPPPLPKEDQQEFEDLLRAAQAPLSSSSSRAAEEQDLAMHPDARPPVTPEFEGDVNPITGEKGGPKREPVRKWGDGDGDWSFKGRVSDF